VRLPSNQVSRNSAGRSLAALGCVIAIMFLGAVAAPNATAEESWATQLKQATVFHQQADYTHAIPILSRLVRQSPRNYVANLMLGEDLLHSGYSQKAIGPLEVACEVRPKDATAEVFLADAEASLSHFPKAAEALRIGIARSGGSEWFVEAWASFCLERFRILWRSLRTTKRGEAVALRVEAASYPEGSKARESLLEESAATDSAQRGIWGELGLAQLELRESPQVEVSLKEAQTREPEAVETLQLEAMLAAVEQDWPVAEERLTALGARSSAEMRSALELWRHVLAPKTAISGTAWNCLRDAAASCPLPSARLQHEHGRDARDLYAEGRWEELVALPAPATADSPEWLWRGVALAKTDNCPHAIPALERGLEADRLVAGFWLEICYSTEAERTSVQLSTEKDQTAFHQFRGDMLLLLHGNAAAALAQYEEALKSQPEDPNLLEKMAEAYVSLGDTGHAQSAARAALALDSHQLDALRTLASLAMNDRDYAQALPWLQQLDAEAPGDPTIQVQLGKAMEQTGNAAGALKHLAPALAAGYPDENGALHALEARALRELGRDAEAATAAAEARRLSDAFQAHSSNGEGARPDANK